MGPKQSKNCDVICEVCKNMPIGTRWKCVECVDFDLCSSCHDQLDNRHGHRFWRIQSPTHLEKEIFQKSIKTKHPVICDECRRFPIVGIRWRCIQCVDFDLCSECYHDGKHDTLGHRFFYTISAAKRSPADENGVRHHGVSCGHCSESPIIGTRWKCSLCADFDLCTLCHNLGPDQHRHRHRFWRIESPQNLTSIIANDLQTRHSVNCSVCNQNSIRGIRWNCNKCVDFNLCSECYHDNKHTSFDSFGHRFCCITTSNSSNSNVLETLMRSNLSLLEPESGPSRIVMIGDSASSANNDSPTTKEITTSRRDDIANIDADDDYQSKLPNNTDASESNADSDQIGSSNSINHNAPQTSTETNLFCVGTRVKIELDLETVQLLQQASGGDLSRESLMDCMEHVGTVTQIKENGNVLVRYEHTGQEWPFNPVVLTKLADQSEPSENTVVYDSEALFGNNDTPIWTTSSRAIRQSHIADHDSDQIESTNSNNSNASQASIDTNLICVGTRVVIELDFDTVLLIQQASSCDWSAVTLMDCMEHVGTVTKIKENGNVVVRYEHTGQEWPFNPEVLTKLADQSGPSENIVAPDSEALFADNDTPIGTTSSRAIRHSHIADHDSDQIESTNSNNSNASQASIDTNLICVGSRVKIELDLETVLLLQQASGCDWSAVTLMDCMEHVGTVTQIIENGNVLVRYEHTGQQWQFNPEVLTKLADQSGPSQNTVVYDSEALFADNDTPIATTSSRAIRQSHIADHYSDQIESTNSNNRNASQASIDTNLICVGSRVKIELDLETLELFQRALGCVLSRESLMNCMEHVGTVTQIKENGNVLVRYEHSGRQLTINPVALTRLADQSGPSENAVFGEQSWFQPSAPQLPTATITALSEQNDIATNIENDRRSRSESSNDHMRSESSNDHDASQSASLYPVLSAQMQQEYQEMKDQLTCPICLDARKKIVFLCRHRVCSECNKCPICR